MGASAVEREVKPRRIIAADAGACLGCGETTRVVRVEADRGLLDYWDDICFHRLIWNRERRQTA